MIARLRGRLADVQADTVIVDVGGVGYRVHVPASVVAALGPDGTEVTLYTRLRAHDSDVTLFGATDPDAMRLFDELTDVSGIGPRLAMALLSTFDVATLVRAIAADDAATLEQAPGVGRRTAQRVVLELKGKVADLGLDSDSGLPAHAGVASLNDDAVQALMALGYSSGEARRAVAAGAHEGDAVEDRIRAALRWLSR